jgi:hypothetical protein
VPDYDILSIIVNDSYIPGAWACIYSAPPYVLLPIGNSYSPVLIRHEIAHIFASLLDEYDIGSTAVGESKNTTAKTLREEIRWNAWIDPATPVPTPETPVFFGRIGLFEGACGCTTGWYRPKQVCIMNAAYDTSSFCEVCREELIVHICKAISLIDTFSPPNSVSAKNLPGAFLSIRPVKPDSFRLATQWSVNGSLLAATSDTLKLADAGLSAGLNTVIVRVIDSSGMVRIPENRQFVVDSVVWTIDNGTAIAATVSQLPGELPQIVRSNDGVHVVYSLLQPQRVNVSLWDMRGALVNAARSDIQCAGIHDVLLGDRRIGSGVYIVRFSSGTLVVTATIPALSR